jgi:membrane-associated PAP2 superfamily phosphatase
MDLTRNPGGIDFHDRSSPATRLLRAWLMLAVTYGVALIALQRGGGDAAIADAIYAAQGGAWTLRDHWLLAGWIHEGGRRWVAGTVLALGAFALVAWRRPTFAPWRRPLVVLLGSVLASVAVVASIKYSLPMDCPWSLEAYGGDLPRIGLFDVRPVDLPRNGCFPAAHASSGFAWVALYFFFARVRPRWRHAGLAFGLGLGAVFAVAQELRGAHFLSHDLTSLMICWTIALAAHLAFNADRHA